MSLLFIGGSEIVLIIFVVLLLFGSKSIPDIARAMGKGVSEFNKAKDEITREINQASTTAKKNDPEIEQLIDQEKNKA
ncbi:MAG: twin-arginine translocase TatA/TatE family subunit [Mangrovibacterium sp.]